MYPENSHTWRLYVQNYICGFKVTSQIKHVLHNYSNNAFFFINKCLILIVLVIITVGYDSILQIDSWHQNMQHHDFNRAKQEHKKSDGHKSCNSKFTQSSVEDSAERSNPPSLLTHEHEIFSLCHITWLSVLPWGTWKSHTTWLISHRGSHITRSFTCVIFNESVCFPNYDLSQKHRLEVTLDY